MCKEVVQIYSDLLYKINFWLHMQQNSSNVGHNDVLRIKTSQ